MDNQCMGNPKTTPNLPALAGVGKMTEEDKKKIYEVVDGDWAREKPQQCAPSSRSLPGSLRLLCQSSSRTGHCGTAYVEPSATRPQPTQG